MGMCERQSILQRFDSSGYVCGTHPICFWCVFDHGQSGLMAAGKPKREKWPRIILLVPATDCMPAPAHLFIRDAKDQTHRFTRLAHASPKPAGTRRARRSNTLSHRFAVLAVKSMAGLPYRHLWGLEDASIREDSKLSNAAARIAPFKIKCAKHMVIKGSINCHDYGEDVFPCVQN